MDESQLTGESDDVSKDPVAAPVCFSGSKVLEGFGRLLVLAVGPNSQQGIINAAVRAGKAGPDGGGDGAAAMRQQTALSAKLEELAHAIGRVGAGAAAATLAFNVAAHTADLAAAGRLAAPWALPPDAVQSYLDAVITSITLLVVAVPEGLPLAVTLALAFSVARMLADNNLVRHLDACETMAGCTTICRRAGGARGRRRRQRWGGCRLAALGRVHKPAEAGACARAPRSFTPSRRCAGAWTPRGSPAAAPTLPPLRSWCV